MSTESRENFWSDSGPSGEWCNNNNNNQMLFKVDKSYSVKLTKANYRKCTAQSQIIKTPGFTIKILRNLQLQSKVMALIFILKVSNVWDSLISFGRVSYNF